MIDVYGFIQKILGKETIENFTLYKNDYDKIVTVQEENSVEDIESKLQEVMPIFEYSKEEEIPYYYITSLLPVVEEDDLPIGVEDYSAENAEVLMHRLRELEIPLIDLRTMEELNVLDKEALFYKTDHHWTLEACFAAFKGTIRELEANLGWELDGEGRYTDIQTYEEYLKENSFLGSYGIKVGKYYAGKDDYLVYIPKINTHFTFEAYDAKHNLILQKRIKLQNIFLFIISLLFYAWGEPKYVILMMLSILINWFLALIIDANKEENSVRIFLLIVDIVFNLSALFVFKYYTWSIEMFNKTFLCAIPYSDIALPIGISFYTFQAMSYVIDVWRRNVEAKRDIIGVGMYISFFPQLIAGPIVRYGDIEKQISDRRLTLVAFSDGITRFLVGFVKKVLLADSMAVVADKAFELNVMNELGGICMVRSDCIYVPNIL